MASGNHQRPPAQLQARIPLSFRGRLFLPQCTPHSRIQKWCIYGIIYNYAPFFLGNPMVTFFRPNYVIPNQFPNPSPIPKEDFSAISLETPWWLPEDHLRTPTTWSCRSWVVDSHWDYYKGSSQRLSIISIIVKASSTQHSSDNSIGP
ncbi:hypothetical protein O181_031027 [Austropuccinia psidii MF-1]|uniref:Uncharacterized protein n=1 Tax=Austropuccinia psidii MF-1 TaxID=1389203 RepID=A0A9Q3CZU5_9BASI|nr:hypothetical protein [Austropuccinia psidii MF-1]